MSLVRFYNRFVLEPDPITKEWPMVSMWYSFFISLGYLYFIYIAGPRFMKNRPPYKLKGFIMFYNIIQILANAWAIKEYIRAGWFTKYGFKCWKPDFDSPNAQMIFNISWWLLLLKIFDYVETCVFVLRKKQKQISVLHVYHHISVVMFATIFMRYVPDSRASFISLINCFVHVVMYTYYFCAACGPKIQRIVNPFKQYLTTIQMVQFFVILVYMSQALFPFCEVPKGIEILPYFTINLLIYIFLFYDFYRKTYTKTTKQKN
ncbi:elongation of very long chain fatty acids protein AAEL008004 isoform X2 [Harpegnathos saltator]|uniref:elongation of very long chain fatty acids protein AAEL008004 isoform X2 n=1 Tax=Harpegnathos saltator TaxID=610380 RepID=UPI00058C8FF3|nr:elongation of very long chain fatty acids protein AAEL008004 isoform X2 [Harpegnathos saltator]